MSYGQSITNYAFSYSFAGSLEDMSSGTTSLLTGNNDDNGSAVTNIGFTFNYMGFPYTQFSVNSNGQMRLGSTAVGGTAISTFAAGVPILALMDGDNEVNNGIIYKVIGTAPNRILVVQWTEFYANWTNITGSGNMQALLYEGTGKIDFVYGNIYNSNSSSVTKSIFISASNTATTAGYVTVGATPTFTPAAAPVANTFAASVPIANLASNAQGSRTVFTWTPPTVLPTAPTNLAFSGITTTGMTLNWTDSPDESSYAIYRSLDGISYTYLTSLAANTITYPATGLAPSTLYYWKVAAFNEAQTADLLGSQSTNAAAVYYWVGTTGGTWNTPANWNTAADGSGSPRTTSDNTDIMIVDGDGIVSGGSTTINVDVASFSLGQFKVTSNTNLTLQSSTTTTRTITLAGNTGADFVIENGSTLNLNNATMAVAFAFTGTGNTGDISGTYNAAGSTSNNVTTTGGTGTLVTVSATGVINNTIVGSSGCLTGSVATLSFVNGSNYTHSSYTSSNGYIPLATWGATSNIFITGGVGSTSITNAPGQTFGNFTYNSTTSTATCSAFTSSTTTVIQGNLTILASNTGKVRVVTTGTLTINGNLVVSGGLAETSNNTGTVNVLGNVSVSGGTFDVAFASTPTLKVSGNFVQTGGNIIQTSATGLLEFNGTSAQTLTVLPGVHGSNAINVRINNPAGVILTNDMSIRNLTVSNGNLAGTGVLSYNGTSGLLTYNGTAGIQLATTTEFPAVIGPSSLTINNTNAAPNNIVGIPFSRRLAGTTGVLTLTSGIIANPTYVLSVSNTAVAGISGGSATSYVAGGLERDLPASLATGTTYNFPVGKSKLNKFALVNPTTNAGGTVTIFAEAFDANCGGTAGALLQSLKTNRYWAASITNGGANFTNSLIQLNDSIYGADAIAASATVNGIYDIVGGLTITSTATSLTSTAPEATMLPGFFVMANKAAPVVSNVVITPSGNQCTNVQRTVTTTVTPGGGAVTGVVINYNINGAAQTPITMTNVSGNDWSGVIPTVTPVNATVTWNIVATDANLLVGSAIGTPYTDEPNLGIIATASISQTTICSGSADTLSVNIPDNSATIGSATTLTGATTQPTAFCNRWPSYKMQIVYTASELISAGLNAGEITSMSYEITTIGDAATNDNFIVQIGATSLSTLTDFVSTTGFTTVFPAATYTHAVGVNVIPFSTPYVWDGISNIIVEVSHDGADMSENAQTYYTETAGNTVAHAYSGYSASLSTYRLNTVFTQPFNVTSYSWSDGSTTVGTTNPLYVNPLSNTTYTATAVINGCPVISNSVSVTTNPLPSTPTANNSTQCGVSVPVCSVTSTSGAPSPTFNWYNVSTGGTPLAGITGNTYTGAAISSTTYYYVAEDNGTCESERVMVTATVGAAPALTITADQSACNNTAAALSVTSLLSDFDSYVWTPSTDLYTDAACTVPYVAGASVSTVYYKTTTAGVYTITCTSNNSGNGCSNVATSNVTVLPATITATAATSELCHSGSSSINVTPATGYGVAAFQWMNSTDNVTFSDIVGANAIDYTTQVITDTMYYKMVVELGATVCTESNVVSINVNNPLIVSTTPATRCGEGTVDLQAEGSAGTTLRWYDVATGGTSIGSGNSFTTPVISSTTSYFVSANIIGLPNTTTIGTGSSTSSSEYTPFNGGYGGIKSQHLLTASELTSAGINAGDITSVALTVTSAGTTYNGFTIQVGNTALADFTSSANIQGGLSTVYSSASVTPVAGINTYAFSTPFVWDGVSNIIVSFSWSNGNYSNTASTVVVDPTTNYSSQSYRKDADTPANILAFTGTTGTLTTSQNRPKMTFEAIPICSSARTEVVATVNEAPAIVVTANPTVICQGQSSAIEATSTNSSYSYIWEPGTLSGSTQTVFPTSATTYSVTAVDNTGGTYDGCITYGSVSVDVNPAPTSLTINVSDNNICTGESVDLFADAISGDTYIDSVLNESFETFPPANWTYANAGTGNSWTQSTTYHTGAAGMSYRWNTSSAANAWAITSPLSLIAGTTYTVSFWYKTGSSFEEKLKVTVGNDTTVTSQTNVLWDNNGGANLLTATWTEGTVTFTPSTSGLYHFGFNCYSDADMYYLYVDDIVISAPMSVAAIYEWTSVPAGFTSSNQNPTGVTPGATTQYIVSASNSYGCSASADTTVTVNPLPSVYLGADQDICDTTTITLDAGNPGSIYTWSTGGASQTEDILGADLGAGDNVVSVTVTTAAGCIGYDDVTITVTICDGIEDPSMQISFFPNPATDQLNLDLSQLPTGDYRFELLDMQGQKVIDRVIINDGTVMTLSLTDVAPGSYIISVTGNNNSFRNYLSIQK